MDFLIELIFSILFEAPLEAVMESKAKCWIKTAVVSVPAAALVIFLTLCAVHSGAAVVWIITAGLAILFGWGIARGHIRGWNEKGETP